MHDYRALADALAADIAAGRLRPGEKLLPLRRFARQRQIADSTAARVYRELNRRGLTVGEVGRGTFVRSAAPPAEPALAEPGRARVDLEMNFPVLPEQPALLARSLEGLLRPDALAAALPPVGAAGTAAARQAAAAHLARAGWAPDPGRLLFAGNGRQALAAAIAALVPAGERLGVEALTYPVVKGLAARLGVTLVPLAMDEDGLTPEALRTAAPLRAVYLQPALHNPLGITMSGRRREELTAVLRELDLYAIEDAIYGFLRDDLPPLAALAPERTLVVDSLSKRLAPGLSLGFLTVPAGQVPDVATALRSGTWTASRFALDAATRWMADGTAAAIEAAKRSDAAARGRLVAAHLAGFRVRADPHAYHCWWELPEPWRADTFVAAAARRGIAVTPSGAFAVGPAHAPNAVRLALGSPPLDALAEALAVLAGLAQGAPEDTAPE
ncbi:PLP-dependent aminotransferase family protein [Streptomyces sioyaensis]|uniref:PLP-dependent aminotransferase family protein n=1 Tax=Streptomyces sioyaensis TaxID=67364 RepID=A0A4Q1R4S5_9ACTN|nr:PLP-dependent aminotransferase family protein [Streptomyces sioyaensis]MBM4792659.1 PLP-dependent aminotransferase family protein [Streptomyces sioyaensis]RXS67968.1 PLP-dependent aminotransferase family protein [Streptomyces sioyaensis]